MRVHGDAGGARPTQRTGNPSLANILDRNFTAEGPDRVWVADTTHLPVLGGFLFLVVILDLFSRKVVGWSIGDRLDAELSGAALRSAIGRRQPRPGLIFHTDRGSEFAAQSFRKILAQIGAVQSMSRKGNCWDNAVAESFFSTLEFEGPSTTTWRTSEDAYPGPVRFRRELLQRKEAPFTKRLPEPELNGV